jgi:arginase
MGLRNVPIHQTELNIGVEDGPDAVISEDFVKCFASCSVSFYEFPKPEDITPDCFNQALAKSIVQCRNAINCAITAGQTQVMVGGDHSATFPSVLAVMERMGSSQEIGYVQFDSHGDLNLQATSPTDNFHGMYVRALVDHFDIPEIEALAPHKLPTSNLLYIGNLDLDPAEEAFFRKHAIKTLTKNELIERKAESLQTLRDFLSRFQHLHITFDVDCLDSRLAPATGIPAADGLEVEDITEMFNLLSNHASFSLDVVEVNPRKRGAQQTIRVAQAVIKYFLSM